MDFDPTALAEILVSYGYTRVPRVQLRGEFALRGEVLDVQLGDESEAYRILFDFDQIESIRQFDPLSQSGLMGKKTELVIHPFKELVWTADRIEALKANLENFEEFPSGGKEILEELKAHQTINGEEYLFPLAFEKPAALADYFFQSKGEGLIVYLDRERLENAQESLEREYGSLYSKARRAREIPRENPREIPLPNRILLNFKELSSSIPRSISFTSLKRSGEEGALGINALGMNALSINALGMNALCINAACDPPRSFFGNVDYLKEEFASLKKQGWDVAVAAESDAQAGRIAELLKDEEVSVGALPFSSGFALPDIKFLLIQENEIFGRRRRPPKSLKTARSAVIDTFVELNPGDYVVHVNYGIGLFKGIERIKALGHERDYISVEYA
jgi:transcription-repair coupling factor (superfamily II helicase)